MRAKQLIKQLNLQPHPEGGFFRRTYASRFTTEEFRIVERPITTMIYYLLEGHQKSNFHRLKSDEIWCFHEGCDLFIHTISENGDYRRHEIGRTDKAEYQLLITANTWFAAELFDKSSFALCSCIVNPGFDFSEFEMPETSVLLERFPQHKNIILDFAHSTQNPENNH